MARPRLPAAVKAMAGTDRADRRTGEVKPPVQFDLTPPAHLEPRSAAVWNEIAPMLRRIGLLTVADLVALEMMCDSVADYRFARSKRGDEMVVRSGKGSEMLSQWMVAQLAASKRAESLMAQFGMDPQSRSKVMANPQGDLFGAADSAAQAPTPSVPPQGASRFFQ